MTDNIIKILRDRKKGARANRIFHRNGKELKQTAVTREFKKYVRKLGFDDRLNFHSLRHTFASWLVQKEVPIYAVSKLLGHADIKTTEIYAHLQPDNLKSAVDLLI